MPTQQKKEQKLPEFVRFIFLFAGAFTRLTCIRIGKKIPIVRSLGRAIEVAIRLESKANKSVRSLKTEHAVANSKLAKIQKKAEETQSQLEAFQLKDEIAAVAEKVTTIKVEMDQLSQQICDCSSQIQPGALDTVIQQNKGKEFATYHCR